jgi:hypothetical protein
MKTTMHDVFKRAAERLKAETAAQDAWEATPEGRKWREAQDAHHRRMAEADARFAAEHPPEDEPEPDEDD